MKQIKFSFSCKNYFGESVINAEDNLSKLEIHDAAMKKVKEGHRNPSLTVLQQCYNNRCKLSITIK